MFEIMYHIIYTYHNKYVFEKFKFYFKTIQFIFREYNMYDVVKCLIKVIFLLVKLFYVQKYTNFHSNLCFIDFKFDSLKNEAKWKSLILHFRFIFYDPSLFINIYLNIFFHIKYEYVNIIDYKPISNKPILLINTKITYI